MALVEIEAGPHRITAAITRDAVDELGLAGRGRDRDGEGDVGDGRAIVRRDRCCSRRSLLALAAAAAMRRDDAAPVSAAARSSRRSRTTARPFEDADASFSFAGSDELAAQIRKGARPDVFAAANTKLPDQLHAEDLVEKPAPFAANRLVLAVPAAACARSRRPASSTASSTSRSPTPRRRRRRCASARSSSGCCKPPAGLTPRRTSRSTGGERIPSRVEWAAPATPLPAGEDAALTAGLDDPATVLLVRTDSRGDFSRYTLRLVAGGGSDEPPAGFDPLLAVGRVLVQGRVPVRLRLRAGLRLPAGARPRRRRSTTSRRTTSRSAR